MYEVISSYKNAFKAFDKIRFDKMCQEEDTQDNSKVWSGLQSYGSPSEVKVAQHV